MTTKINISAKSNNQLSTLIVTNKKAKWSTFGFSKSEIAYLEKKIKEADTFITINQFEKLVFVQLVEEFEKKNDYLTLEAYRTLGNKICAAINAHKYDSIQILETLITEEQLLAIAEGIALSNYQFIKYLSDKKGQYTLKNIHLVGSKLNKVVVEQTNILVEAVCEARNLVNEPQNVIDAV